ncbi:MAG: translocation/assembly module TamB domain-containing protein, partial [Cycloclasticus sp.]|nr:translocation/assembly module TamB domain-containing protein [Cycloclasticus sp.]
LTIPSALSGRSIVINEGTVSLSGTMSAPMLTAQADVVVDAKDVNISLSSRLDAAGNNKFDLLAKTGKGLAKFNGSAKWTDLFKMNGVVTLTKFDPALLAKDWPGVLSGGWQMSVSEQVEQGFDVKVDGLTVAGTLRQRTLKILADANYLNGHFIVPSLQINTAQSVVRAKGHLKDQLDFNWSIDSPSLADFHPDLTGQLQASGTLLGDATEPSIRAKIRGKNITYSDYVQLGTVDSDVRMEMLETGRIDTTVNFLGLSVNDVHDINGTLAITGRLDDHTIAIQANDKKSTVSARAFGGFAKQQWQGKFNQLQITQGDKTPWQADKFGTIVLTKNSANIAQHCLQADLSRFCLQARYADTGHWQSQFDLTAIPVNFAQAYSNFITPLHGELIGNIKLNGYESYPTDGSGQLSVQDARVLVSGAEETEKKFIVLNELNLSYQLNESKSFIDVILAPDLPGVSPLTGRLMMADIKTVLLNPEKSSLSGYLKTAVDDLSVIDSLHTDYDKLKGQLKLDLTVSGTVKNASINGQLALIDGQVYLPRLGLSLEDLNIAATGDVSKGITLDYRFKSGKGQLTGAAQVKNSTQGWNLVSSLKGENIEVVNLPEAYVIASPDLLFKLNAKTSQLSGSVRVPTAELVPVQFNASVTASDDVVIINGPVQKEERSVATDFNVNLSLGDKVKVNGLGFEGRLTGKLLVSGNSKKLLLGTGDIFIKDGSYEAYGQKLDIDNGKIQFAGDAIENPNLDIKATRKSGKVVAGLQLTGTVDDPLIALFSRPSMSDDDILSYLMIGRPLAGASAADAAMLASAATGLGIKGGNMLGEQIASTFGLDSFGINGNGGDDTALQIGKYLSPKLYLSYGIGLFEPVSTVNLNYELNENWSVKTESGVETGVDILYSRER